MNTVMRFVVRASLGIAILMIGVLILFARQGYETDRSAEPALPDTSVFIGRSADFLIDHGEIGVIDAGTLPAILGRMTPNEGRAPGVGLRYYEGAKLWLHFKMPQLDTGEQRLVLRLDNTRVREARLVVIKDGQFSERSWSYDSPERRAGQAAREPLFGFDRAEIEGADVLLGFNSLGAMRGAVYLQTERASAAQEQWQAHKYGLLVGFLMALAIYLLVIGARIVEGSLIFAAGLCFFAGVFILGVGGYLHTIFLAPWPKMADVLLYGTQPIMMTFWVLLVVTYLEMPKRAPLAAAILIPLAMLLSLPGLLTVAHHLGYPIPFITDNGTPVLIGLIAGLVPLIWYSIRGDRRAQGFLACFTPIALSTTIRLFLYLVPTSQPRWVALFESFADVVATMALLAILIVLDIRRREARLRGEARRNELRLSDFAEIGTYGVLEVGHDGIIRTSAGPLSRLLALEPGLDFRTTMPGLAPAMGDLLVRSPLKAHEFVSENTSDHLKRWISLSSAPIRDESGAPDGFRAVISDISENVAERENESRRNTLAALGHLAGGIAHEVNNLLHPIISLSRRVSERYVEDADGKRLLDLVVTSGVRAGEIVKSVLRAYTPEGFTGVPVALDRAVHDATDTVRATLPASCRLETLIEPISAPQVRVGEMIQVISNLANNAIRATGATGRLSIRLVGEPHGPVLIVADDGPGMPEAIRSKAIEPFVTGSPGGIGLGLSIVRRIVSGWNADFDIVSETGQGTTIRITFKASNGEKA